MKQLVAAKAPGYTVPFSIRETYSDLGPNAFPGVPPFRLRRQKMKQMARL